ncbi:hypothetical protein ACSSS7_000304 [Eimeria intestinalis]
MEGKFREAYARFEQQRAQGGGFPPYEGVLLHPRCLAWAGGPYPPRVGEPRTLRQQQAAGVKTPLLLVIRLLLLQQKNTSKADVLLQQQPQQQAADAATAAAAAIGLHHFVYTCSNSCSSSSCSSSSCSRNSSS